MKGTVRLTVEKLSVEVLGLAVLESMVSILFL
jgi:hypothetical protein